MPKDGTQRSLLFPDAPPLRRRRPSGATFGVVYAVWGATLGVVLAGLATGDGYGRLPVHGAVGGFIGGALSWRCFVAAAPEPTRRRGVLAGLAAAPLATAIAIFTMLLEANVAHWVDGTGEAPMSILQAIPVAVGGGLGLQMVLGWVALPVGAVIGAICARLA